jgi:hypothetical protein
MITIQPTSARNGNSEVPVHKLKAKQGYTVRKMEKDKMDTVYLHICARMKFRNKKKFQYDIPAYISSTVLKLFSWSTTICNLTHSLYHQ